MHFIEVGLVMIAGFQMVSRLARQEGRSPSKIRPGLSQDVLGIVGRFENERFFVGV